MSGKTYRILFDNRNELTVIDVESGMKVAAKIFHEYDARSKSKMKIIKKGKIPTLPKKKIRRCYNCKTWFIAQKEDTYQANTYLTPNGALVDCPLCDRANWYGEKK